jgi:hypothetical protein
MSGKQQIGERNNALHGGAAGAPMRHRPIPMRKQISSTGESGWSAIPSGLVHLGGRAGVGLVLGESKLQPARPTLPIGFSTSKLSADAASQTT